MRDIEYDEDHIEELPDAPDHPTESVKVGEIDSIRETLEHVSNKNARAHIARNWISDVKFQKDRGW